jgi:hypothetical protein
MNGGASHVPFEQMAREKLRTCPVSGAGEHPSGGLQSWPHPPQFCGSTVSFAHPWEHICQSYCARQQVALRWRSAQSRANLAPNSWTSIASRTAETIS